MEKVPALHLIVCANTPGSDKQNTTGMYKQQCLALLSVWYVSQQQQHHWELVRNASTLAPSQVKWLRIYIKTRSAGDSEARHSLKGALQHHSALLACLMLIFVCVYLLSSPAVPAKGYQHARLPVKLLYWRTSYTERLYLSPSLPKSKRDTVTSCREHCSLVAVVTKSIRTEAWLCSHLWRSADGKCSISLDPRPGAN